MILIEYLAVPTAALLFAVCVWQAFIIWCLRSERTSLRKRLEDSKEQWRASIHDTRQSDGRIGNIKVKINEAIASLKKATEL